jgi:hypothetical protein
MGLTVERESQDGFLCHERSIWSSLLEVGAAS